METLNCGRCGLRQRDATASVSGRGRSLAPARRSAAAAVPTTTAKLVKDGPSLAIVGTTGAVGQEFLSVRVRGEPRVGRQC